MRGCGSAAPVSEPAGKPACPWLYERPPARFPSLEGDLSVDVAVVGGGIAGLTAAALLRRSGATVAVIEARRVGRETSGRSAGDVSALQGLAYGRLSERRGAAAAHAHAQANQAAVELVAALAAEGPGCGLMRVPAHVYVESTDALAAVEREVEAAAAAGLSASFTQETELPFPVAGAVRLPRQVRLDPYRYLAGLAATIPGDGSHVFELTRALEVEEGEPCRVRTDRGTVVAGDAIVATHLPIIDRGLFFARTRPERSYLLAARVDADDAVDGMYLSTEVPPHSVRGQPSAGDAGAATLLIGGERHPLAEGGSALARLRRLESHARERFRVRSIEYRWSAHDYAPPDGLPYIGPITPLARRLHVATGFDGWGLASGTVAGTILADAILERPNPSAWLYDPARAGAAGAVATRLAERAGAARHRLARGMGAAVDDPGAHVATGEAKVIGGGREQVAVHRDAGGRVHAVSALCTHRGCTVRWNDAKGSWYCPCHGSRFDLDGHVLEGPAVRDLEPWRP